MALSCARQVAFELRLQLGQFITLVESGRDYIAYTEIECKVIVIVTIISEVESLKVCVTLSFW